MFKIALRNVFRQKRRTLLTVLTIFVGYTLCSFSIGWSDGTYAGIINAFTRNRLGHIQIHYKDYLDNPSIYKNIPSYNKIINEVLKVSGVDFCVPRIFAGGLASVKNKSVGVIVSGIDPAMENKATNFDKKVIEGENLTGNDSHNTLIGEGLAKILNAKIGSEVVIVSQAADGSIANDIFKVIGIVKTGDPVTDRMSIYLGLGTAQDFFVLPNRVHEIGIIVDNINNVFPISKQIRNHINNPDLSVEPWQVFAKSFYQAMQADVDGMWVSLFIIMLIVGIGVLNTILMSVLERTREYGLFKAMGTKPADVFRLIFFEVLIISFVSIILGTLAGMGLNYWISIVGVKIPEPITYGGVNFSHMYSKITPRSIYIPFFTVFLTAILVSIWPGMRAAKTEPAKTMRMN